MKVDAALNWHYGGIVLMWLGPALIVVAGFGVISIVDVKSWPTATAHVLRNEVDVSQRAAAFSRRGRAAYADYYTANCTYQYQRDGQDVTDTTVCAEGFDRREVERLRRKYSAGAEITIHYSPRSPHKSVLTAEADTVGLILMFGFGVMAIPLGLACTRIARQLQPAPVAAEIAAPLVARRLPPMAEQSALRDAVPSGQRPSGQGPIAAGADVAPVRAGKSTHWLVRGIAVGIGLIFVLFGGLLAVACLAQMAKGADAPAAAKVGLAVQIVATTIFGLVALFGGFLIWLGLKRRAGSLAAAQATLEPLAPAPVSRASVIGPDIICPLPSRESPAAPAPRPSPRERLAPGSDLGQLIAQCGPEKSGQWNSYLWGGAMLAFAFFCILAPNWIIEIRPGHESMSKMISLGMAGLSLAFAIGIVWTPLFGAPQTIELYEHGIIERLGKQVRRIELDAIERLQLQEWYEHRFAARTFNVKAQVQGQRQLAFSSTLRGEAERIIEYLASHIPLTEFVEFNPTL